MPDLPAPVANRLPRPRWLDPRLVVGLLLVLACTVGGSRVVASADDTVQVWAAARDLAAGAPLDPDALVLAQVRLEGREASYLAPSLDLEGLLTSRPLAKGELLAAAGVHEGPLEPVRAVSVATDVGSVGGVERGSVVDVYVVRDEAAAGTTRSASSTPVLEAVPVLGLGDEGTRFSSGGSTAVTLQVPETQVGRFLASTAAGAVHLAVVPAGAPQ